MRTPALARQIPRIAQVAAVLALTAGLGLPGTQARTAAPAGGREAGATSYGGSVRPPGGQVDRTGPIGATWRQQTPAESPPKTCCAAMAYDATGSRMILYGGNGGSESTWAWDGSTWTLLEPDTEPTGRNNHAMAYDPVQNAVIFNGGFEVSEPLGDTWAFADGQWRKLRAYGPMVLQQAMDFDPHLNQMLMFGGTYGEGERYDNTWTLFNDDWQLLEPATVPSGRIEPGLAYDPGRDALVMFGGWGDDATLSDTWMWDGTNWNLEELRRSPSRRASVAMTTFGQHVALFGGYNNNDELAGDHVWILKKHTWKRLTLDPSPQARAETVFEWDPVRREAVLFGGERHYPTLLNDTWTLTPTLIR